MCILTALEGRLSHSYYGHYPIAFPPNQKRCTSMHSLQPVSADIFSALEIQEMREDRARIAHLCECQHSRTSFICDQNRDRWP